MNAYGVKAWCGRLGRLGCGGGVFVSCCRGSNNCSLAHAMDGRISAAAPLALDDQLPLPMIVKRGWSGFVPVDAVYKNLWL